MPDAENSYLIKRPPPYVFAEVDRLTAEVWTEGRDIVRFAMGNPDMDAPARIVETPVEKEPCARRPARDVKRPMLNADAVLAPYPQLRETAP